MAWETGTATNHIDLLDKLRLFLTTNTDLVNAGHDWEVLEWDTFTYENYPGAAYGEFTTPAADKRLVVKGPGKPGMNPVIVGFQTWQYTSADRHGWISGGMVDYVAGGDIFEHPGAARDHRNRLVLWNSTITYWFVASDSRIIVVAQVGTVFYMGYYGHYLPFAAPSEIAHPIFISGSAGNNSRRYTDPVARSIISGVTGDGDLDFDRTTSPASLRREDGIWSYWVGDYEDSEGPYRFGLTSDLNDTVYRFETDDSDELVLEPVQVLSLANNSPVYVSAVYGELEGLYKACPLSATPGSTVTINTRNFLIFNNGNRNTVSSFGAVELI